MKNQESKKWYFTFGIGDENHAGNYVILYGTWNSSRERMFSFFGKKWAFQYSEDHFKDLLSEGKFENLVQLNVIDRVR